MRFIGSVIEKLQRHPKRIVFPEGTEPRVLQAARQFYSLRLGIPILLGDRTKVKEAAQGLNVSLEGVRIINPSESEELDSFVRRFESLRRSKGDAATLPSQPGLSPIVLKLLADPNSMFAASVKRKLKRIAPFVTL